MIYNEGTGENKDFILSEGAFATENLAKFESVMCQGNGYMCVRGALEELASEPFGRFTLVAGTFNRLAGKPCNELPNTPDFSEIGLYINGERVTPEGAKDGSWSRTLNMRTGLLERSLVWCDKSGAEFDIRFQRVVSLKKLHLAASRVEVTPRASDAEILITTGINGEDIAENEHLTGGEAHEKDGILQTSAMTTHSELYIVTSTTHKYFTDGAELSPKPKIKSGGKKIAETVCLSAPAGSTVAVEKTSCVFTSRDKDIDAEKLSRDELSSAAFDYLKENCKLSFDDILAESADEWERRIWSKRDIKITPSAPGKTDAERDQLALRFAVYQLTGMSPVHDNRMNIGAKGMSGPGYYGHAFWDTEMYMLPYFIFAAPDEARSLVEYRFNGLEAARKNAARAGFSGARFPWESAWITDGEATPEWCDTGDFEVHITADVAYGAYYYYMVTGDEDFMERCGYELIFSCAAFWASRLDYNEKLDRYEIRDVIGPNEYKCHIDNNAYTNYMAHNTIVLAMQYAKHLRDKKPELYKRLDLRLSLGKAFEDWQAKEAKIYLPRENADGIIPEDDTFLTLPSVVENGVGISLDPAARQRANELGYPYCMVSKQADVVALFYILEDLFSPECKKKNFYFYDRCCFHDSSLSLSTYSALAADLGEDDMAYSMFTRATVIDIGGYPQSSDSGVHAASLGGIWQCCALGFGGVRRYGALLRIEPHLPKDWKQLDFMIHWHGEALLISATHTTLTVKGESGESTASFISNGKEYTVGSGVTVKL